MKIRVCKPYDVRLSMFRLSDANSEDTSVFPVVNIVYPCIENGVAVWFCVGRGSFEGIVATFKK